MDPTFVASFLVFIVIVAVMAVGVLLGRSPLKGSCGGKGGPDCVCDAFEQERCKARERMMERIVERRAKKRKELSEEGTPPPST